MKRFTQLAVMIVAFAFSHQVLCAAPRGCEHCARRSAAPVGGWHPYGGGLLHWWNPCCFNYCRLPDDYCRKPLPQVCCPPPGKGPMPGIGPDAGAARRTSGDVR